jgi:YHS domain-containing protein
MTVFWILLRLLLLFLLLRALWRLVRGVLEGSGWTAPPGQADVSVPLQRDPVCGTFVVPSRALTISSRDGTKYFCSDRCRRAYAARRAG